MNFIVAAGLTLCLALNVLSSAEPVVANKNSSLNKRVVPVTPPQGSVVCLGYSVSKGDILAAMNQGLGWATTNPPTRMGSSGYPHIYSNHESLAFPNCAGSTLWEYPVLRYDSNPWVPAKSTKLSRGRNGEKEPDRVIFVATNANSVTYCGTITHDPTKLNNKGELGAFVSCT